MKKIILGAATAALLAGCAISQRVEPARLTSRTICVMQNRLVRDSFRDAIVGSLQTRGFEVRIAADEQQAQGCPSRLMYNANWTWDLAMYMRRAELIVFEGDRMAGRATYDASSGGARLDKFIDASVKVDQLVGELFPAPAT